MKTERRISPIPPNLVNVSETGRSCWFYFSFFIVLFPLSVLPSLLQPALPSMPGTAFPSPRWTAAPCHGQVVPVQSTPQHQELAPWGSLPATGRTFCSKAVWAVSWTDAPPKALPGLRAASTSELCVLLLPSQGANHQWRTTRKQTTNHQNAHAGPPHTCEPALPLKPGSCLTYPCASELRMVSVG